MILMKSKKHKDKKEKKEKKAKKEVEEYIEKEENIEKKEHFEGKGKSEKRVRTIRNVERKSSLLDDPNKLLTPSWFWNQYINRQIVPLPVAHSLLDVADPQLSSPISNCSKLDIQDNSGVAAVTSVCGEMSPCPPPPTLYPNTMDSDIADIITIARQRRLRSAATALSIEDIVPKDRQTEDKRQPKPTTSKESLETADRTPPVLDRMLTAHDFEVVWRSDSLSNMNRHLCSAEIIQIKENRKMANHEIIFGAIKNGWYDDLEIQIESRFYYVDRYLFTHYARNFRHCSSSFLQFPVQKVQMGMLVRIYEWMLGDDLAFPIGNELIPFFAAAKFLGVKKLMEQYWGTFSKRGDRVIWELNAFHTFLMARQYQCEDIMAVMLERLRKCFLPVVASRELLEFDVNELAYLLGQDMLCVNSEDEIFFTAIYWLRFAWAERKKHAVSLMSKVRFSFLSPWLLRSIANNPENECIAEIGQKPEVCRWMWESVLFSTARMADRQAESQRGKIVRVMLKQFQNQKVAERYWTFCPGVPHHHDIKCPRFRELTFESFKRFLHRLHSQGQHFMDELQFIPNKNIHTYRCCSDIEYISIADRNCPRPHFYDNEQFDAPD
ncbi:uncharacterized protein LOC108025631 [Drosophila biarmipes]|uniref:uncharacterized protein LOC108025631 n=1 Tax=Drosophila biarmipes TaxID=125945 RepID=UPI0007E8091D|nr:uncharacterized protein LOC108025631 [Drosophila biarmipes]